jgi:O-antigen ligase
VKRSSTGRTPQFLGTTNEWPLNLAFAVISLITCCNLNGVLFALTGINQLASPILFVLTIYYSFQRTADGGLGLRYNLIVLLFLRLVVIGGFQVPDFRDPNIKNRFVAVIGSALLITACARITKNSFVRGSSGRLFTLFGIASFLSTLGVLVTWKYPTLGRALRTETTELGYERVTGFFSNPNEAGFQSCITLLIILAAFVRFYGVHKKKRHFWMLFWLLIGAGLTLVAIFVTFSRSALLVAVGCLVIAPYCAFNVKSVKSTVQIMVAAAGLVVAMGIFASNIDQYIEASDSEFISKRLSFFTKALKGEQLDDDDKGYRTVLLAKGIDYWWESPVFGHGLGKGARLTGSDWGPHNTIVLLLIEGGIVPALLLLLSLSIMLRYCWRIKDGATRLLLFGYMWILVSEMFVSHGVLWSRYHSVLLGLSVGLSVSGMPGVRVQRRRGLVRKAKNRASEGL